MTKILFIAHYLYPIAGGGETSVLNLLSFLSQKGFECKGICFREPHRRFNSKRTFEYNGFKITQENDESIDNVKKHIEDFKPDIVLSQSYDSDKYLEVAKKLGIKTILWIHFYNGIVDAKGGPYTRVIKNKNQYKVDMSHIKTFLNSDKIIANSDFMSEVVKLYTNRTVDEVIYPIISYTKDLSTKADRYISFVNPCLGKGLKIIYQVAQALPEYKFLVLGKLVDLEPSNVQMYMKISCLPNVKLINKRIDDMSYFYNLSKLILVPSLVDETFNMVTLEALFHGIPAIVSDFGNLPLLVKDGAGYCEDTNDVTKWIARTKELMSNENTYQKCINAIDDMIVKYSPKKQCDKFVEVMENLL